MIELPEAMVFAEQFNREVRGRRILAFTPGNAPHKYGGYNRPAEEYAAVLPGRTIGDSVAHRNCIFVSVEPGTRRRGWRQTQQHQLLETSSSSCSLASLTVTFPLSPFGASL